jgi:hypothetical protein
LSALQVTHRKGMMVFNLALARDGHRQLNECSYQLSVDFLAPLCRNRTGRVEEQRPVDRVLTRYRPESKEIWKERHGLGVLVQLVAVANLRMAVPIGSVGKLERYGSAIPREKPLRALP